jgi:hypothetical protein
MCAFSDLYDEFVSLAIEGRDSDMVSDLVERYDAQCVDLMHRMSNLVARIEAEIGWKMAMWQDARDYEIGIVALEALRASINEDLVGVERAA